MKSVLASFTLFTRLPAWRICDIPASAYSQTVVYWPLTGWLTGGCMALCISLLSSIIPLQVTVIFAIILRLLLTGALHEDGLADFCDGFGGGKDKESVLRIMKDSSIGSYGVIGLISHFFLLWVVLSSLSPIIAALAIFSADPIAKATASQLTNILPYARPEGAKNKISYSRMSGLQLLVNVCSGLLPLTLLIIVYPFYSIAIVFPVAGLLFLASLMKKRIGGYTGDCCGATFLICESLFLIGILFIYYI